MTRRSLNGRAGMSAAVSASMDRARQADHLQARLESAGWTVTRVIGNDVSVICRRPLLRTSYEELRFGGPTVLVALTEAARDLLGSESEGGEA